MNPGSVAIIGAGSSGIAAAKALHERDLDFDCYEASDRVGGNWVFANKNGMSAAYRDLHINTSRDRMAFSDFPMADTLPDFPHHKDIAAYFDAYVDHFGFRDRILFETSVARAAQLPDGTWELTDAQGAVRRYDMLLVANGHHWDPRRPEPAFTGSDVFEGRQLHAHDYRDNDFLRDKDVVVSVQLAAFEHVASGKGRLGPPRVPVMAVGDEQHVVAPHGALRILSLIHI